MTSDNFPMAFERSAFDAVTRERDDAQEATESYHAAWIDAVRRGDEASLDAAYQQTRRQLAEENAAKELEFRANMEHEWGQMKAERDRLESQLDSCRVANGLRQRRLDVAAAERDRLREALKRYGRHESGPDGCQFNPCTCGLDEVLENR